MHTYICHTHTYVHTLPTYIRHITRVHHTRKHTLPTPMHAHVTHMQYTHARMHAYIYTTIRHKTTQYNTCDYIHTNIALHTSVHACIHACTHTHTRAQIHYMHHAQKTYICIYRERHTYHITSHCITIHTYITLHHITSHRDT